MPLPREIQQYIQDELITPEQAERLTPVAIDALQMNVVRLMLELELLTIEHVIQFTPQAFRAIQNPTICHMLFRQRITAEQLIGLTNITAQALADTGIQGLISYGRLTIENVLALNRFSYNALRNPFVVQLVMGHTVTAAHLATITEFGQSMALHSQAVRELIVARIITVEEALQLTINQRLVIENTLIRQRLIDGDITIAAILADQVALPPRAPEEPVAIPLNNAQSTHTASVHRSASESALRLAKRYPDVMRGDLLEQTIQDIINYVDSINYTPEDSLRYKAAKRCVTRLVAPNYPVFIDSGSRLSIRQLLVLVYTAINDHASRVGLSEDAHDVFIEGLYEIQRGYNLTESMADDNAEDSPICPGGTFNKLIEKMVGIHPDCELRYITFTQAAIKLPQTVSDVALQYFTTQMTLTTECIQNLEAVGVECIWEFIEEEVSRRMFEEFGSLFRDATDQGFIDLVDEGRHLQLSDLAKLAACVRAAASSWQNPLALFSVTERDNEETTASPQEPTHGAAP